MYAVGAERSGDEILCSQCGKRVTIDIPVGKPQVTAASNSILPKGFDFKRIGIGTLMLVGGIACAALTYFSWTKSGRIRLGLPLFALVLIFMGAGSILKGIGGDAIEWD